LRFLNTLISMLVISDKLLYENRNEKNNRGELIGILSISSEYKDKWYYRKGEIHVLPLLVS